MLAFLYYNHLLLYHGTGSIRGVQQAPRIRMYWRVGALKELAGVAAATARHFNREFTTGFLGPPHAGVVKCPILGILDITKNSSHLVDHIPIMESNGWVM